MPTAVGFTTGSVRCITSLGPLIAGLLVSAFGSFNRVTATMSYFALFSAIAKIPGRESKDRVGQMVGISGAQVPGVSAASRSRIAGSDPGTSPEAHDPVRPVCPMLNLAPLDPNRGT